MHPGALRGFSEQLQWACDHGLRPSVDDPLRVLDMGGQDVNGTVHSALRAKRVVGQLDVLDIEAGPGVTIVGDARNTWWHHGGQYDLVISTEMLEHLMGWPHAVRTAAQVLHPGGWFVGTCASIGRQPHGATGAPQPAPGEWYCNVGSDELAGELGGAAWDLLDIRYQVTTDWTTHDLYWAARRRASWQPDR